MGDGTFKQGAPKLAVGIVDVRDVAEAHFNAAMSKSAIGRYIVNGHNTNFYDLAILIHKKYGDKFPIPNKLLPKWLLWLVGPILNKNLNRKFISNNVNHIFKANNSKSKTELNIEYKSLEKTLYDAFDVLVESKII